MYTAGLRYLSRTLLPSQSYTFRLQLPEAELILFSSLEIFVAPRLTLSAPQHGTNSLQPFPAGLSSN